MYWIDLNCDLGEGFGNYEIPGSEEMISIVTSANIACGMHGGDPMIIHRTVEKCLERGIGIGAHPGYPDLQGFGRRQMAMTPDEIYNYILYQLGALSAFTAVHGTRIRHISTHGEMGNYAKVNEPQALAIMHAVHDFDPRIIVCCANDKCYTYTAAKKFGLRTQYKKFHADRSYTDEGLLVPRSQPGALIEDEDAAIGRLVKAIREGTVETITGKILQINRPESILLHGDQPKALLFARKAAEAIEACGIRLRYFGDVMDGEEQ